MTLAYYFVAHDPWDDQASAREMRSDAEGSSQSSLGGEDARVVAAVRAGDAVAFRGVFDIYAPRLLGFAYARLGSHERAEDLVQQLFASIWVRRAQWEIPATIGAYLFRAIRNLIAREFRDQGVESRVLEAVADTPPERIAADATLTEHELQRALVRALQIMPPRPREIFLLSRERCLSYAEIAVTLGISVKTVELHMTRALAALRDALEEWRI